MKKIHTLQAARGLAALMVLGFHAHGFDQKFLSHPVLPDLFTFGQTGLDLFFVLSGFVMAMTTANRKGFADSAGFLLQRGLRIYPTYWIYFFALVTVQLLLPSLINKSGRHIDQWGSFLLLPSEALPLLVVAWSLTLELWFYLVFAILMLVPTRTVPWGLAAWLASVLLYRAFGDVPSDVYQRVVVHPFSVEFIFGALAGRVWVSPVGAGLSAARAVWLSFSGLALVALACMLGFVDGSDVISTASIERVVLIGAGYSLLLLGMAAVERAGLRVWKPLVSLGDCSYTLYLSHMVVMAVWAAVWLSGLIALPAGPSSSVVFWILTFSSCVVYAFIAYRLTERPLLGFFRSGRSFKPRPASVSPSST